MGSTSSFGFSSVAALAALCGLLLGAAFTQDKPAKHPALAFCTVQVSNLEKSVRFYQALGFTLAGEANPPWKKDEEANRLFNAPGAMRRTATLTIASTASGKPFTLYLQEFTGIDRGGRMDFPARDESSTHIGLMVPEADALWAQLQSAGMLRPLSWEGKLIRMPGQTSGGLAYIRDPDGFNTEIIGVGGQRANRPTLHHLGLSVLDSDRAKSLYGTLLGGEFPTAPPDWVSGDMYDSVVGGHGCVIRLINGTFPEAAAPQTAMRFELVQYQKPNRKEIGNYRYSDIGVSCAGFEVEGLGALYGRMKAAGIETWSKGGIVQRKDGNYAVVVRDPDVGSFVELFEKPK